MRTDAGIMSAAAASLLGCATVAAVIAAPAVAPDRLEMIRHSGDLPAQRRFAWNVFLRVAQPAFESWYGEDAVFAAEAGKPALRGIRGFSRSDSNDGASAALQSADAPLLTYTLYNGAAYRHIRKNRLYLANELAQLRKTAAADRSIPGNRSIADFPVQAAVLKTALWPVAHGRLTAMPVWDPQNNPARSGGNDYMSWKRVVAVDARSLSPADGTVSIEFAGRSIQNPRRIDLNDMVHVSIDAHLAKRLSGDGSASKAAWVVLGRPFEAGDYLVLVGANLATKQMQDWVWATLWWHDRPDDSVFAANRPANMPGEWRHYLLQAALDSSKPTAADGGPHICFNPWMEGRFANGGMGGGTVSNCQSCHRRASYPAVSFLPVTRGEPDPVNDPAYRPGRLRTNFIWSIAMHAQPERPPRAIQ